jgi:cell fate regulator YaaT (PSP1 superfamily)
MHPIKRYYDASFSLINTKFSGCCKQFELMKYEARWYGLMAKAKTVVYTPTQTSAATPLISCLNMTVNNLDDLAMLSSQYTFLQFLNEAL